MKYNTQQGRVLPIVIILIGIATLWWFRVDLRSIVSSKDARNNALVETKVFFEKSWDSWLSWYATTAVTFAPIRYVQSKVDTFVSSRTIGNASSTKAELMQSD